MSVSCRIAWGMALLLAAGCGTGDTTSQQVPDPSPTAPTVVVVGDATAEFLVSRLSQQPVRVVRDLEVDREPRLVVIVQDAMTGAMPLHRALVERHATRKPVDILWVLTNTNKIDDRELLELEELEARELLTTCGLPGDTTQFAFDAEAASTETSPRSPQGWEAIVTFVLGESRP
jgi:hypothetical protein